MHVGMLSSGLRLLAGCAAACAASGRITSLTLHEVGRPPLDGQLYWLVQLAITTRPRVGLNQRVHATPQVEHNAKQNSQQICTNGTTSGINVTMPPRFGGTIKARDSSSSTR
eukprot:5983163-Amphidinium_carterae.1